MWEHIYGGLGDEALPADPDGLAALKRRSESLSIVAVPGARRSKWTEVANGATYKLDKNAMGFLEVGFTFNESGGVMRYKKHTGEYSIAFGYGEHVRQTLPEHRYDCIASGAWGDENTLNIVCYAVFEYCGSLHVAACFRDDTITVKVGKIAEWFLEGYSGIASGKKIT